MINELNCRFSNDNQELMKAIQCLHPSSVDFLSHEELCILSKLYEVPFYKEKTVIAHNFIQGLSPSEKPESLSDLLNVLLVIMYPTITTFLRIALTIPVTSCTCKRSFSVISRINKLSLQKNPKT